MFDSLSDRLNGVFKKLSGQARLDEKNIQEGLREVRLALLEADVNFKVVKEFIDKVRERCLGLEVSKALSPTQQLIKVVNEELTAILGGETEGLALRGKEPHVIMLVGLQGSGKTTSAAKIANWLRTEKHKPYLAPADVYRPAAIDQLVTLAGQLGMPCYPSNIMQSPVAIAQNAVAEATRAGCDVVLVDTAGRLHIDDALMQELVAIKEKVAPVEILFVADALTGQEAVNVAQSFNERLGITGVVLTKMDGDARGGAALSIKSVTGKNVKFVGMGEKISELELFHPDRIAGRILGMGDMLTLIEKTQGSIEEKDAEELARKMQRAEFDLEDFLINMKRIRKLGSLDGLMKMIPGLSGLRQKIGDASAHEKDLSRTEAIIYSMTPAERKNPKLMNGSRKLRVAKGSGTTVAQVNRLLKQFDGMKAMMQNMAGGKKGKKGGMQGLPMGRGGLGGLGGLGGGLGMGAAEAGDMMPQGPSKTALKKKKMLRKANKKKRK